MSGSEPAGERWRTRSDVRFRRIEEEAVVLRQDGGEVLVLNGTGARVLELLAAGFEPHEAARRLTDELDVDLARAADDVRSFAAELGEAGVLEPRPPEDGRKRP